MNDLETMIDDCADFIDHQMQDHGIKKLTAERITAYVNDWRSNNDQSFEVAKQIATTLIARLPK